MEVDTIIGFLGDNAYPVLFFLGIWKIVEILKHALR